MQLVVNNVIPHWFVFYGLANPVVYLQIQLKSQYKSLVPDLM